MLLADRGTPRSLRLAMQAKGGPALTGFWMDAPYEVPLAGPVWKKATKQFSMGGAKRNEHL